MPERSAVVVLAFLFTCFWLLAAAVVAACALAVHQPARAKKAVGAAQQVHEVPRPLFLSAAGKSYITPFMFPAMLALFLPVLAAGAAPAERPHVVFVLGEPEYKSEQTLPEIARELESKYGMRTTVLKAAPDPANPANIPGLEALATADLAVFFMRFRLLPKEQVQHIRAYLDAGKPVVGLRTSTHAFSYPEGHELESWNKFGEEVLGAPWIYHYGHTSSTDVSVIPAVADHPILQGVAEEFRVRSWLYHVLPNYPPRTATPLLMGKSVGEGRGREDERPPNPVAWTYAHKGGGRVFTTTMGHPEDFQVPSFRRLLINGIHWALGRPVP